ncbi:MAG: cobalamin-binding protein [Bacteroidales bacterium]
MNDPWPKRIVCLTEETTETLYLLGEEQRIAGITSYTVRPERARKEKPVVSAFTSANIDAIIELQPDLVLGFSDIQADIAAALIRKGIEVYIFNQRSVEEILNMILRLGTLVGQAEKAGELVAGYRADISGIAEETKEGIPRPVIWFEEWYEPMISGIRWVSELIEIAGGTDCFPEFRSGALARDRIVKEPQEVVRRNPDIIIGSWCGRSFRPDRVVKRPGWENIKAVKEGELHEIDSSLILQPGPAALTDGLKELRKIIRNWQNRQIGL